MYLIKAGFPNQPFENRPHSISHCLTHQHLIFYQWAHHHLACCLVNLNFLLEFHESKFHESRFFFFPPVACSNIFSKLRIVSAPNMCSKILTDSKEDYPHRGVWEKGKRQIDTQIRVPEISIFLSFQVLQYPIGLESHPVTSFFLGTNIAAGDKGQSCILEAWDFMSMSSSLSYNQGIPDSLEGEGLDGWNVDDRMFHGSWWRLPVG